MRILNWKKNSTHYYSLAKINEALRKQNREEKKHTHTNQSISYIIFVYAMFLLLSQFVSACKMKKMQSSHKMNLTKWMVNLWVLPYNTTWFWHPICCGSFGYNVVVVVVVVFFLCVLHFSYLRQYFNYCSQFFSFFSISYVLGIFSLI